VRHGTDDLLTSVTKSIVWFTRQVMYLKAHEKPLWFFGPCRWRLLHFFCTLAAVFHSVSGGSPKTFFDLVAAQPLFSMQAACLSCPVSGPWTFTGIFKDVLS